MRNPPPLIPVVKNIARQYPLGRWMDPVVETLCDAMNAMLSAPRVNLPAVFLQSELDTVVTRLHQNELIDAYAGPRRVVLMEGLSHSDVATEIHEPLIRESLEWLWTQSGCKTDEPSSAS
jgi:alpha-beta hydrolase superfamily lysophospholipase